MEKLSSERRPIYAGSISSESLPSAKEAAEEWIKTMWGDRKLVFHSENGFLLDGYSYFAELHQEGNWMFFRMALPPVIQDRYLKFSPKELNPEA